MRTTAPQPVAVVTVVCADPRNQPPRLASRLDGVIELRPVFDASQLCDALPASDVAFVWDFGATTMRDAWTPASRVRWIHVASAGVDPLLFPELLARGVVVTNSRGVFDDGIAEFVLGAMLAAAKGLPETIRLQREGRWFHRETRMVAGSTVLVVGAGSVGRAVGQLAKAVGCEAVGVAREARDDPSFDRVVAVRDLGAELPRADFVVITAPLTEHTAGLFDESVFAKMKARAVLINVGRGPIIDEDALLAALDAGRLGGAVLDVFGHEPLPPDHPFWARDDVVVSPHMSGDFEGYTDVLVDLFVDNLARWRSGQPLRNVVDQNRGY